MYHQVSVYAFLHSYSAPIPDWPSSKTNIKIGIINKKI